MKWHQDRIFLVILILTAGLAFINLGSQTFWGDDAQILNIARSITRNGMPVADERFKETWVYLPDVQEYEESVAIKVPYETNIGGISLYTHHPWMASYVAAIPIMAFGHDNEFFIRAPFVLIGLAALILVYKLSHLLTKQRAIALLSTLFLGLSYPFLLAIRHSNYYSLLLLLVPAITYSYLKSENTKHAVLFVITGFLLVHTQWLVFVATMIGIGGHYLLFQLKKKSKQQFFAFLALFLLSTGWLLFSNALGKGGVFNTPTQYALILSSSIYLFFVWFVPVPLAIVFPFLLRKSGKLSSPHALLLMIIAASYLFFAINKYSGAPIRYFYGILPLAMILMAEVVYLLHAKYRSLTLITIALLLTTNALYVGPFMPFKETLLNVAPSGGVLTTTEDTRVQFFEKTLRYRAPIVDYILETLNPQRTQTAAVLERVSNAPNAKLFAGAGDGVSINYYTDIYTQFAKLDTSLNYTWITLPSEDPRNANISDEYVKEYIPLGRAKWEQSADPTHRMPQKRTRGFYLYTRMENA